MKKWSVSSARRRERRRRPAPWACVQPSGVSFTRWSGMVWWMSRFSGVVKTRSLLQGEITVVESFGV